MNSDDLPGARSYADVVPVQFGRAPKRSLYLAMRDGVRLAIDVHLPDAPSGKFPAILRQTRYFRAIHLRSWAARVFAEHTFDPINAAMRDFFVRRGYAWIDADVRGSGASFGKWLSPWSPDEVKDGAQILDWIVAQPWSDGRVGSTGNSYDGTAAELLATNGHPALKAIAPRCSLFDVYTDIAYPGGVHQNWFTRAWTRANRALDANKPQGLIAEALGQGFPAFAEGKKRAVLERFLSSVVRGVVPVDEDRDESILRRALGDHGENMDVDGISQSIAFRDDLHTSPIGDHSIDLFSPSAYPDRGDVATFSISGWFDGAYQHAAIKRHLTLSKPGDKLLLGPWNHGCSIHGSPYASTKKASFYLQGELLRFFDQHLRDRDSGFGDEPVVRYFEMGGERWKNASVWPPPEMKPLPFYLRRGGRLDAAAPSSEDEGATQLAVDRRAFTGKRSRWRTLISPFVVPDYKDRPIDRTRVFLSAPLDRDLSIAGHPIVHLFLKSDAEDGAVFVYLDQVAADGRVLYVTEGQLRLLFHEPDERAPRRFRSPSPYRSFNRSNGRPFPTDRFVPVAIDLLPVAYQFAKATKIRLTISGADVDHFAAIGDAAQYAIAHKTGACSYLELPGTW